MCSFADKGDWFCVLKHVCQAICFCIAAGVAAGRQRRAAFDFSIRLKAYAPSARRAPSPMRACLSIVSQEAFERPEIANVVPGEKSDSRVLKSVFLYPDEQRKQIQ